MWREIMKKIRIYICISILLCSLLVGGLYLIPLAIGASSSPHISFTHQCDLVAGDSICFHEQITNTNDIPVEITLINHTGAPDLEGVTITVFNATYNSSSDNYEPDIIAKPPFTIATGSTYHFFICYATNIALQPGIYTLITHMYSATEGLVDDEEEPAHGQPDEGGGIQPPNNAPSIPAKPDGEIAGFINTTYEYSTNANDPDNDDVYYWFDWGDNTNSGWLGPYASGEKQTFSHQWATTGMYMVRVKAKDTIGQETLWSEQLLVLISGVPNYPPETPAQPEGPTNGTINVSYIFKTMTTDLDNHSVKYVFDWGDNTTSTTEFVSSGTPINMSHQWHMSGAYLITVKAIDELNAESTWSAPHTIIISSPQTEAPLLIIGLFLLALFIIAFLFILLLWRRRRKEEQ